MTVEERLKLDVDIYGVAYAIQMPDGSIERLDPTKVRVLKIEKKMKKISLLRYLLLNMRYPLGFVSVTLLFILYWVLVPDEDTPTSIKWTLIGDATLLGVIAGVLTIKWWRK